MLIDSNGMLAKLRVESMVMGNVAQKISLHLIKMIDGDGKTRSLQLHC